MKRMLDKLAACGIQPTPQRIAVAEFVLNTANHPTADEVWMNVRDRCPTLSRATVYNTLNLFAEKGLLKTQPLKEASWSSTRTSRRTTTSSMKKPARCLTSPGTP